MNADDVVNKLLEDEEPALLKALKGAAATAGWTVYPASSGWFEAENPAGSSFFIYVNSDGTVDEPRGTSIASGTERNLRTSFVGDPMIVAKNFVSKFSDW